MLKKRLVLRLSSLGDIILSTAALEVPQPNVQIDWAIAEEYKELLESHPRIHRLLVFRRTSGSRGWGKFCRHIWENCYDEVVDLHKSLRTRLMRIMFIYWGYCEGRAPPQWHSISKQKFRLYPYFIFKKAWPRSWRPTPWVQRFTNMFGPTDTEKAKPNLRHLIREIEIPSALSNGLQEDDATSYLCVMPSSRWDGKKWPVAKYFELLKKMGLFPVILGSQHDPESLALVEMLRNAKMPHFSGVNVWSFRQTARVLAGSQGYLGGDTGLAHLAESVGVPAKIIFGPTAPDMGFGPWMTESQSVGSSLWCRPCGKDGRACFRITDRYLCLKGLSAGAVFEQLGVDGIHGHIAGQDDQ
jgi:ADP-heptose:LPS heptosyltransferase